MSVLFSRISGVLLVIGAVIGLVLSIAGLIFVWSYQASVVTEINRTITTMHDTTNATTSMLTVVSSSLEQANDNIELIEVAIDDVASTIDTTSGVARSVGTLIGDDFEDVLVDTQASLDSVETSAKLIDDTLRIISAVPLIGARYRPAVPLQSSIAEVNSTLGDLSPSFDSVQGELEATASSLETIRTDLQNLSTNIAGIKTNLGEARQVLDQYQTIVNDLQTDILRLERNLPLLLQAFSWGLTAGLVWLAIAQLSLLTQGAHLLTRPPVTYL